jgi:hypothetical protein
MSGFVTGLLFTLGVIVAIAIIGLTVIICGSKVLCAVANMIASIFKKGEK